MSVEMRLSGQNNNTETLQTVDSELEAGCTSELPMSVPIKS